MIKAAFMIPKFVSGSSRGCLILLALLMAGCAETTVRAGGKCGVIYSNGVSAWVPCAEAAK